MKAKYAYAYQHGFDGPVGLLLGAAIDPWAPVGFLCDSRPPTGTMPHDMAPGALEARYGPCKGSSELTQVLRLLD